MNSFLSPRGRKGPENTQDLGLVLNMGSGKPRMWGVNRKAGQWKDGGFWHRPEFIDLALVRTKCVHLGNMTSPRLSLLIRKMGMFMLILEYFCEEKAR